MNNKIAHTHSQQQLSFDMFSSLGLSETQLKEVNADLWFKKSSLLVDVSDIGIVGRRIINGCYFIASESPEAESHSVDLRYFKWLISYTNSNNIAHLKKVVREAQKSSVQVNVIDQADPDKDAWVSVPMLGATGIKGGKIIFKIPVELRSQLRDPERYSLLSMRILAAFTSIYALELYEHLAVFRAHESSPWWSLEEFRDMINVDDLKIANDYRYFRRDIIQPALDQINNISDMTVTIEARRTGRSVSHIRFIIQPSDKGLLPDQISSRQLYEALTKEFAISDSELDEIADNREKWSSDRIWGAIEATRERMLSGDVKYPAKYLMKCIRDGVRIGEAEKKITALKAADAIIKIAKKEAIKTHIERVTRAVVTREDIDNALVGLSKREIDAQWKAFGATPLGAKAKEIKLTAALPPMLNKFKSFVAGEKSAKRAS